MFDIEELTTVYDAWINRGIVTAENKKRLKAFYFQQLGIPEQGCTTCEFFWLQVQVEVWKFLKLNGIRVKKVERKYQFVSGTTYRPFSSHIDYVMEGEESETTKVLSDSDIDGLIEQQPDLLGAVFVLNPYYKEGEAEAGTVSTFSAEQREADPNKDKTPPADPKTPPATPTAKGKGGRKPAGEKTEKPKAKDKPKKEEAAPATPPVMQENKPNEDPAKTE